MTADDAFASLVARLPWLEHERLWREHVAPGARNRACPPEPGWRCPEPEQCRHAAAQGLYGLCIICMAYENAARAYDAGA